LRRQFDRVPLDAVDARHAQFIDTREHVMQTVAELVEQRDDFVVREAGGLAADRRREVAGQIRDRRLHAAVRVLVTTARIVHPGAAAFAFARIQIEVELRDEAAVLILDAEKAHVRMPHGASSRRIRTPKSVSVTLNSPLNTASSGKYCLTSFSENE
jgi:hypothetical protein